MSTIDIFRFSTLQVGTCRKCAKSQRKAWGSKNGSPDLCKHQKAKLRKSIEGRFCLGKRFFVLTKNCSTYRSLMGQLRPNNALGNS